MVLVLAGVGLFVYLRLRLDLNESIDAGLQARWTAAAELFASSGTVSGFPLEDPEEAFVHLVDPSGSVLDSAGLANGSAVTPIELEQALDGPVRVERRVRGIDGTARMLAGPVRAGSDVVLVVAGQSLGDRDEALRDLLTSLIVGGPVAVVVASVLGYGLARVGLSPIEAIRRTAAEVSSAGDGRRLPVPDTRDEVHRLAVTLNEMIERLERSFERERRFVADASHELRTPIAVVKTELEAALLFGDCGPQAGDSLRAAIDECDSLAQLAEDLLVIARTSEAGLPLAREPVFLRVLLEDVRDRFTDRAGRHGRVIKVDLKRDGEVVVDPVRMRQALANLVDNALRHGAGDITLSGLLDVPEGPARRGGRRAGVRARHRRARLRTVRARRSGAYQGRSRARPVHRQDSGRGPRRDCVLMPRRPDHRSHHPSSVSDPGSHVCLIASVHVATTQSTGGNRMRIAERSASSAFPGKRSYPT